MNPFFLIFSLIILVGLGIWLFAKGARQKKGGGLFVLLGIIVLLTALAVYLASLYSPDLRL